MNAYVCVVRQQQNVYRVFSLSLSLAQYTREGEWGSGGGEGGWKIVFVAVYVVTMTRAKYRHGPWAATHGEGGRKIYMTLPA